jgi:hypothetical protein
MRDGKVLFAMLPALAQRNNVVEAQLAGCDQATTDMADPSIAP